MERLTGFTATVCMFVLIPAGAYAQEQDNRFEDVLDKSVSFVFEDIHVSEVCAFISRQFDIQIILDERVIAPAPGHVRPATNVEYVTDGNIPYVRLRRVSVRQSLEAILKPLGLAYSVEPGFIWVSTPELIKHGTFEQLETRIFDLPGTTLPDKNAAYQKGAVAEVDLVSVLRRATPMVVDPQSGELLSYLRVNVETHQVVAHNTPTNLDRLEQLLDLLLNKSDQD